jgi:hypothetical protein
MVFEAEEQLRKVWTTVVQGLGNSCARFEQQFRYIEV